MGFAFFARMTRILVPFDFSPLAFRALRLALGGFPPGDPERLIDVVYVHESGGDDALVLARLVSDSEATAKDASGVRVEQRVLHGPAGRQLVAHAEATSPDLIILGARSHGTAKDLFVGRTAFRVLRHTRASVLMLKRDETTIPLRSVVCALDLEKSDDAAMGVLKQASHVCSASDGKLSVVHLIEEGVAPAFLRGEVSHLWAQLAQDARVKLDALVRRAQVRAEVVDVLRGHVREQLPRFVERVNADLVVVGSEHKAAIERLLLGSFAETVVQITPCDVFVVR
jgi:nucleotide-binding universal stress UspA family protein